MREIISLSDQTISQIAAGEIVENPASIIKELVENAIDAKATSISIRLSENLLDEIRISDNGEGIPKDQIKKLLIVMRRRNFVLFPIFPLLQVSAFAARL